MEKQIFKVGETYKLRTSNGIESVTITEIKKQNNTMVASWTNRNDFGVTMLSEFQR